MIPFDYIRARDVDTAVSMVSADPRASFLAGGTNLVDHMKLGVAQPSLLVDVSRLPLGEVEQLPGGGIRIGAAVRNSDLAAHSLVRTRYPVLSRALLSGASAQLRNVATTAGNLLQRTRCVYFQDITTPCNKREPGTGCSALGGYVRYHAIFGATNQCVAVHPSDMAVALAALDAVVIVRNSHGERRIPLLDFYRLPGDMPERDTVLVHGELVTGVELPAPPPGNHAAYRKVRDRAAFAFALVSVAAEIVVDADRITSARIALGGVAHRPWRAVRAEEVLVGSPPSEDVFAEAAEIELAEAHPLPGNEFKVALTRRVLASMLRSLTGQVEHGQVE